VRRALALALLACAVALVLERLLARSAAPAGLARVGSLLTRAEHAALPQSGLCLEIPGQGELLYGSVEGRWRCLSWRGAPADRRAILELIAALSLAPALERDAGAADAAAFGLDPAHAVRVSVCGPAMLEAPDRDARAVFDVGARTSSGGAFVRRRGDATIWAVEADVLEPLAPRAGRVPLIELGVVPSGWPGWVGGLVALRLVRAQGSGFELARAPIERVAAQAALGVPHLQWILDEPGAESGAAPSAEAYVAFLQRAPFADVLDERRVGELGVTEVGDALTLVPATGAELVLSLGEPLPDGRVPLWNADVRTLYALEADVARLLAPAGALLRSSSAGNPWEPHLRR
jgi:hypothetical protein